MMSTATDILKPIFLRCIVLVAALAAASLPVRSDDNNRSRHDHYLALEKLRKGEILPLEKILVEVRKSTPGEFVDVELRKYHKSWVYRFKILTPRGALIKVIAHAKTGVILKIKLGNIREELD